jgi:hypothetical protein
MKLIDFLHRLGVKVPEYKYRMNPYMTGNIETIEEKGYNESNKEWANIYVPVVSIKNIQEIIQLQKYKGDEGLAKAIHARIYGNKCES